MPLPLTPGAPHHPLIYQGPTGGRPLLGVVCDGDEGDRSGLLATEGPVLGAQHQARLPPWSSGNMCVVTGPV